MTATARPVLDWTYGEAGPTYDLPGGCLTCGQQFIVRRRKGMKPPLHVECPNCECTEFSWQVGQSLSQPPTHVYRGENRAMCGAPVGDPCKECAAAETVHRVEQHRYSPDAMAMGDCRFCGRRRGDPIHALTQPVLAQPAPQVDNPQPRETIPQPAAEALRRRDPRVDWDAIERLVDAAIRREEITAARGAEMLGLRLRTWRERASELRAALAQHPDPEP